MATSKINDFINPLNISNYTINLNNIVPEKPFFFYEGCSNNKTLFTKANVKIIAFNNSDNANTSGTIFVDNNFIKNLKSLLPNPNNVSTVSIPKDQIFYNSNGPANSKKDDIYIDCQPTNEDGELIVPLTDKPSPTIFDSLSKLTSNSKEFAIIKGLFGLFIMFIILWAAKSLMQLILSKFSTKSQSGGGNNVFNISNLKT